MPRHGHIMPCRPNIGDRHHGGAQLDVENLAGPNLHGGQRLCCMIAVVRRAGKRRPVPAEHIRQSMSARRVDLRRNHSRAHHVHRLVTSLSDLLGRADNI